MLKKLDKYTKIVIACFIIQLMIFLHAIFIGVATLATLVFLGLSLGLVFGICLSMIMRDLRGYYD